MNTTVMFSSKTNEWGTPQSLFDELDREFCFTLDPCSTHENAKCKKHYTSEDNGLAQDWTGEVVFCNPPYGREIPKWVEKAATSNATTVMLIPARTDTRYFHNYIYGKAEVRFLRGRVRFERAPGEPGDAAPFPSMIVVFRQNKERGSVE